MVWESFESGMKMKIDEGFNHRNNKTSYYFMVSTKL
jgi:hypothetical protein